MKSSWQTKKLNDVLTIQNGYAFDSKRFSPEKGVPLIRIRDLKEGIRTETRYTGAYDERYLVRKGDLLIGMDGEFGCYEWRGEEALLNQRVCRLQDFKGINSRFLFYGINKYLKDIEDNTGFTTVKHISSRQIGNIAFPFPESLVEQEIIVEKLDEIFLRVTEAKVAAEKNFQNSKELFEAYVQDVFANPGKDWEEKKLSEILDIERGGSPRPIKKFLTKDPDGINWIKIGDTKDSDKYITATAQKIKPEGLKKSRLVYPGDFLLSNSMSFGRPYILKITGAIHDGWLVLREKDPNLIDKDYLYNILSSAYVFSQFDKLAAGSTVRNLNINLVSGVRIPVPKISEQKAIVKKLDAMYAQTKRLGEIYKQKIADLEELKKSALSMAFSGELSTVVDPVRVSPQIAVAVPSPYIRNQVHAAIVDQVVRDSGSTTEVAVAKYDHLLQELCGLSLGYQFATHQFGPFDNQIKRLVSSGLGKNKWFTKRSGMIVFGSNVSALLSRQSNLYHSAQASMKELSRLGITKLDADGVELLSTVCHSIKETGSVTVDAIRTFMSNWQTDNNARTKAEKFSLERTQKCLDFILKNNLHQKLLPTT